MAGASVAIDFDEFGSLDLITLPGQKVAELQRIIAAVTDELKPASFIERMLARDYALQVMFGHYLRSAKKALIDELSGRVTAQGGAPVAEDANVIGKVFADNLPAISTLVGLETNVSCERDRIAQQFDNRRTAALQMALASAELATLSGERAGSDGELDDDAID